MVQVKATLRKQDRDRMTRSKQGFHDDEVRAPLIDLMLRNACMRANFWTPAVKAMRLQAKQNAPDRGCLNTDSPAALLQARPFSTSHHSVCGCVTSVQASRSPNSHLIKSKRAVRLFNTRPEACVGSEPQECIQRTDTPVPFGKQFPR